MLSVYTSVAVFVSRGVYILELIMWNERPCLLLKVKLDFPEQVG